MGFDIYYRETMFNKRDGQFSFDHFARVQNALPAIQFIFIATNKFSTGRIKLRKSILLLNTYVINKTNGTLF